MKFFKKIFRCLRLKRLKKKKLRFSSDFLKLKEETKNLKIKIKKTVYPVDNYTEEKRYILLNDSITDKYIHRANKYWETLNNNDIKKIKEEYNVKYITNKIKVLVFLKNLRRNYEK